MFLRGSPVCVTSLFRHRLPFFFQWLLVGIGLGMLSGCDTGEQAAPRVDGGNIERGRQLLGQYQCGSCHVIPGVAAAVSHTGPALDTFARRSYIAGHLPNQPESLIAFIIDPPSIKPGTLMPAMGVSADDARHMAAYLYSLR